MNKTSTIKSIAIIVLAVTNAVLILKLGNCMDALRKSSDALHISNNALHDSTHAIRRLEHSQADLDKAHFDTVMVCTEFGFYKGYAWGIVNADPSDCWQIVSNHVYTTYHSNFNQ